MKHPCPVLEITERNKIPLEFNQKDACDTCSLRTMVEEKNNQLASVIDIIARSNLTEEDGYIVEKDSCGKPIYRKSGKILVPADNLAQIQEHTKVLQKLASITRKLVAMTEERDVQQRALNYCLNKLQHHHASRRGIRTLIENTKKIATKQAEEKDL